MTREQFLENYLKTAVVEQEPDVYLRVMNQLIESVYDLQQQINELQEKQYESEEY